LAEAGKILYIIDGPYGEGGVGRNGPMNTVGSRNFVTVPSKCWKVIMVLNNRPGDDLQKVGRSTRLIAVIMPNDMDVDDDWSVYRTSVANVEKLTGYKFFSRVPADIINPLKQKVDKVRIPYSAPIY
jgi:endonuclease G